MKRWCQQPRYKPQRAVEQEPGQLLYTESRVATWFREYNEMKTRYHWVLIHDLQLFTVNPRWATPGPDREVV